MKSSSTGLRAGRAGRAGCGTAAGAALRLISRVVARARTPTRPRTTVPRTIVRGLSCSKPLARDIIVSAAERQTSMAGPTGTSLASRAMSRRILRLDRLPAEGLRCPRRETVETDRRWFAALPTVGACGGAGPAPDFARYRRDADRRVARVPRGRADGTARRIRDQRDGRR